jgi:hypothetical protein
MNATETKDNAASMEYEFTSYVIEQQILRSINRRKAQGKPFDKQVKRLVELREKRNA